MEQIILLLQSAILLLSSLASLGTTIPDDVRLQATDIANRAVTYASQEMTRLESNQTKMNQPTGNIPVTEEVTPAPQPEPSNASIEIVTPITNKGLNRKFTATPDDEDGQLHVGAIVRDAKGEITKTAEVTVTATDTTQNQVLKGTGDVTKITLPNGKKEKIYYYAFNYEFRTSGKHTITFSVDGLTKSVEVEVE